MFSNLKCEKKIQYCFKFFEFLNNLNQYQIKRLECTKYEIAELWNLICRLSCISKNFVFFDNYEIFEKLCSDNFFHEVKLREKRKKDIHTLHHNMLSDFIEIN
jgi:hypothetical protein